MSEGLNGFDKRNDVYFDFLHTRPVRCSLLSLSVKKELTCRTKEQGKRKLVELMDIIV